VIEGKDREDYALILDLLTPVAKSYPSEMGILCCSQGLQVLGGYGYCDEFPLEQFYRDCRIHPIHEGTTGIHGMDLLGRKVTMKNGRAFDLCLKEVEKAIESGRTNPITAPYANRLHEAIELLKSVTERLKDLSSTHGTEFFLADATLYLEMFGIIAVAWQWLRMGTTAAAALENNPLESDGLFYRGKLRTMKYFFHYELVKTEGLAGRLLEGDGLTVETSENDFFDL
jgi:butyryl-CoA dehydrogenase